LVLLFLYLVFGVVIPSFADYSDVWDALTSLSLRAILLLTALTLVVEGCKAGAYAILTTGISFGWAFLAQEQAVVVSNTVPGPSGTAARFLTYRKLGVSSEEFGQSYVVNGVWTNAVPLMLPGIALLLLSTQREVPGSVVTLAVVGLVLSLVVVVVAVLIMHSERWAYRIGEWSGRVLNWGRGVVHRPPTEQAGAVVVRLRFQVLDSVRQHWAALTGVVILKEVATFLVLLGSLRALDVERSVLTAIEVFAVYSVVRLVTMVEITPGNIGIVEPLYIGALLWASDGADEATIVAAVFVFRMFTYLLPILVGLGCGAVLSRRLRSTAGETTTSGP
jgi:uncharacterized membrane protein YbhN (UPF0104 family)